MVASMGGIAALRFFENGRTPVLKPAAGDVDLCFLPLQIHEQVPDQNQLRMLSGGRTLRTGHREITTRVALHGVRSTVRGP